MKVTDGLHAFLWTSMSANNCNTFLIDGSAKILIDDSFVGPGYAVSSSDGEEAARVFAGGEGILLDHVYTAKAAAALLDFARGGRFKHGNVLFIHTGGNAGIFY